MTPQDMLGRGWALFPCKPGTKVPATQHGCKDASHDPDQPWLGKAFNVGVATGQPSGIWVLDVDSDQGLEFVIDQGGWPDTLCQQTPSGGYHFVFQDCGYGNTARKLGPDLDTRGTGGYIVVAPSFTDQGSYAWLNDGPVNHAPGWLLRLAREAQRHPVSPAVAQPVETPNVSRYVEVALDRECAALAAIPSGGRNHALNASAYSLGQLVGAGVLDSATVYARLLNCCVANGLYADDGERSCRQTIASGLTKGTTKPRRIA